MTRQAMDLSNIPLSDITDYQPYVVGDTFNGQTFNGRNWLDKSDDSTYEAALNTALTGINTTVAGVNHPFNKGDTDFAAAEKEKARINRDEIQARAQRDSQRGYQLGNRDARVEGDKDAAARASSQFNQRMKQQSAASGGGAAVLASMNVQDPTASVAEHRQRADAQHRIGSEYQVGAESAKLAAVTQEQNADTANRIERDRAQRNTASAALSRAPQEQAPQEQAPQEQAPQEQAPQEQAPEANVQNLLGSFETRELQDYVNMCENVSTKHSANPERVAAIKTLVDSGQITNQDVYDMLKKYRGGNRDLEDNSKFMASDKGSQIAEFTKPDDNILSAVNRRF